METTTREQNIERIANAMPNWGPMVRGRLNDYEGQTLRKLAAQTIRMIDQSLAYGSETPGLGSALNDVTGAAGEAILDNLAWWDAAYQAWYLTTPSDGQGHGGALDEDDEPCPQAIQDRIHELIFSGSSDLALALAERWSNEELTPDEQSEYGISYDDES